MMEEEEMFMEEEEPMFEEEEEMIDDQKTPLTERCLPSPTLTFHHNPTNLPTQPTQPLKFPFPLTGPSRLQGIFSKGEKMPSKDKYQDEHRLFLQGLMCKGILNEKGKISFISIV